MQIGQYQITGEIARGGMGVVYRAHDPLLKRDVAIKVTAAGPRPNDHTRQRFLREAQALAKLRHPNVVGIHNAGEHQGGFYLVMDLLEGQSLQDRIDREGPLPVRDAAEVVRVLAEALDHAHDHGILHRDVKPANVIQTRQGVMVLTDFGLAKDVASLSGGITTDGGLLGTPGFWPPEQAAGRTDEIGPPADVYALGATLFALVPGRPPYFGESLQAILVAMEQEPPPPPSRLRAGVPASLDAICLRCLERPPEARYPSAGRLARDLGRFLDGKPVSARARAAPSRSSSRFGAQQTSPAARQARLIWVLASVCLLLLAVVVGMAWQWSAAQSDLAATRAEPTPTQPAPPQPIAEVTPHEQPPPPVQPQPQQSPQPMGGTEVDSGLELIMTKATAYVEARDFQAALEVYRQALEAYPDSPVVLVNRGALHHQRSDYSAAMLDYARALEVDPHCDMAYTSRAMTYNKRGQYMHAISDCDRALQISPINALAFVQRAIARKELQEYQAAIADCSQALELNNWQPFAARAYLTRAEARIKTGDFPGAVADSTDAIKIFPGYTGAYVERASARRSLGDMQGAVADLTKALELNPRHARAWSDRGLSRAALEDHRGALEDYTHALEVDASKGITWNNRAITRSILGDTEGALEDFGKALELNPETPVIYYSRGLTLHLAGRHSEALPDLERAWQLLPRDDSLRSELARHLRAAREGAKTPP